VIGNRRRADLVAARPIVRAVTAAVVFLAFGNLLALGCIMAWLRALGTTEAHGALWLFGLAAVAQFAGGLSALVGWAWSR
jgi:hypothetical protein